jgi:hypothetical protein
MELDILKHFIGMNVEVLVAGVWMEGNLKPIVKGVVVLQPIGEMMQFYGPSSMKADVIQAIRQVKKLSTTPQPPLPSSDSTKIISSFEQSSPTKRFVVVK